MTTPSLPSAYIDPTALLPVFTGEEPVAEVIQQKLAKFRYLLSANILEAEIRVAFALEGREFDDNVLSSVNWIMPNRRLDAEMSVVLQTAQLHPIRLWHLAVALFFDGVVPGLVFVTLDEQQETAARELGLAIA